MSECNIYVNKVGLTVRTRPIIETDPPGHFVGTRHNIGVPRVPSTGPPAIGLRLERERRRLAAIAISGRRDVGDVDALELREPLRDLRGVRWRDDVHLRPLTLHKDDLAHTR